MVFRHAIHLPSPFAGLRPARGLAHRRDLFLPVDFRGVSENRSLRGGSVGRPTIRKTTARGQAPILRPPRARARETRPRPRSDCWLVPYMTIRSLTHPIYDNSIVGSSHIGEWAPSWETGPTLHAIGPTPYATEPALHGIGPTLYAIESTLCGITQIVYVTESMLYGIRTILRAIQSFTTRVRAGAT